MFNDHNGQISLEYILLLGLVLIIVLALVGPFGQSIETDQAMTAAKNGINNATNDLAYNNSGNIFKLDNLTFNNNTGQITANIYSMKSQTANDADQNYIQSQTINTIAQTLNKPISGNKVLGNKYNYTLTINWIG